MAIWTRLKGIDRMIAQIETIRTDPIAYQPILDRLQTVYRSMDSQYQKISDCYGFECTGCDENCCRTRFHHYTLAEYLYLHQGYDLLDTTTRREIRDRADAVQAARSLVGDDGEGQRKMCPLNAHDRCLLYTHRPMICRLHGIPHELRKPGQSGIQGPGCQMFAEAHAKDAYIAFDRTPLYARMADLERSLRQALNFTVRLKMTVADMFARVAHQ
jgi:Fe-S-cluster containining protein